MDLKSFAETYWSMQEKKLDPVGKEDGDVDNDGDKDSSDSYLMKRRKAIAKAMKKEEVEKEETEVVEHHQKDANGKVIEHEDEAPGTPSSVEEENDNYVEAYLDELKKTTMGSYISKASSQLMKTSKEAGETSPLESGGAIRADKMKKALKRRDGIKTAAKKMAKEETVLEQLAENGREIDAFEAVISYLIDEGFAKSWEEAQDIMVTLKPELVEEVYQNQLKKLEEGTGEALGAAVAGPVGAGIVGGATGKGRRVKKAAGAAGGAVVGKIIGKNVGSMIPVPGAGIIGGKVGQAAGAYLGAKVGS